MELQEMFDAVVRHLWKQGCQARDPVTKACAYRTLIGLKCAIGSLITDEEYSENMENKPCSDAAFYDVSALTNR